MMLYTQTTVNGTTSYSPLVDSAVIQEKLTKAIEFIRTKSWQAEGAAQEVLDALGLPEVP